MGGEHSEIFAINDVAHLVAGNVGLKKGLDRRDGPGFLGLEVSDELGEFFLEQFILRLEAGNQAEDFFQDLAQGQAAVDGGGFAQLVERVVVLGFT